MSAVVLILLFNGLNELKNSETVNIIKVLELIYATGNLYSLPLQMFHFKRIPVQNKNQLYIRKVSFGNGQNCIIWFNIFM